MKKIALLTLSVLFVFAFASISFACGADKKGASSASEGAESVTLGDVKDSEAGKAPSVFDSEQAVGTKATCPVLGNEFTITEKTQHSEYKGKYVYFCCPMCKPQFDKEPEKFLKKG